MKDDRLISLNAAIDALNKKWGTCIIGESLIRDAWDTLKTLPSAQLAQDLTNGCTDTISRQAALDALGDIDCSDGVGFSALKYDAINDAVTAIKALPSAQPVEDARTMCGECDAWNKYKNYQQPEQFNPCTVCQEFDCTGCKFRRT